MPEPAADTDILSISCQSPRFNFEAGVQKVQSDLVNSKDFLPNATINSDNVTSGEGANKQLLFDKLKNVPKVYRWAQISPIILGVLSLISVAVVVFLSTDRRKGIRRVAITFLTSGAIILLIIWLMAKGFAKASEEITKQASTDTTTLTISSPFTSRLHTVQKAKNQPLLMFGIAFVALALGGIGYLLFTKSKTAEEKVDKLLKDEDWPDKEPEKETSKLDPKDKTDEPKLESADRADKPKDS